MKAGPYHGFLVTDPAHIRHVLQDNARNYHKSPLYDRLRDEVMTMLLAGHETTSLGLSWTYCLLSRYPDAESAVADEVGRVLARGRPSFAYLEQLPMTRRVIEESLRLYPPA
jgi:cytochrome P450